MIRSSILMFLFLLLNHLSHSQPQATFKRFTPDGEIFNNELVYASDDSTFYIAGSQQFPSWGTHVTKFNLSGVPIWSKRYSFSTYERYPNIHATEWGDLIITTYPPNLEPRVRCVDRNGNYKWGSVSGFLQHNFHATSFSDGTIYIVHYSSAGPSIIKTDSLGAVKWKKSYFNIPLNAGNFNETVRIGETGVLISGYAHLFESAVVMHIDSTGAVVSSTALIPSDTTSPRFTNLKLFKIGSNKFWLSGTIGKDAIITEFDSSGTFQWATKIHAQNCVIGALWLSSFNDGRVAMAGTYSDTIGQFRGSCAGILNSDGTMDHAFRFGDDNSLLGHDNAEAVTMKNGTIILSAFERMLPINSTYNPLIGIVDSSYSGIGSCYTAPIQLVNDTISFNFIPTGTVSDTLSFPPFYLSPFGVVSSVAIDSILCNSFNGIDDFSGILPPDISIFPNPSWDIINIKGTHDAGILEIHDISGRRILVKKCSDTNTTISVNKFTPGIYLITYYLNGFRSTQKFTVLHQY